MARQIPRYAHQTCASSQSPSSQSPKFSCAHSAASVSTYIAHPRASIKSGESDRRVSRNFHRGLRKQKKMCRKGLYR